MLLAWAAFLLAPAFLAVFFLLAAFFFETFFFETFFLAAFFFATFFLAAFFFETFFFETFFLAAFFFATFFLTAFFFATFFLLTRFLDVAFFLVPLVLLAAAFRDAAFLATFLREVVAFFRFLLAALLAGIFDSCRTQKRRGLYIACRRMEVPFFTVFGHAGVQGKGRRGSPE